MTRIAAAILLALTLAGCESDADQDVRITKSLPDGCKVRDLGHYRSIDTLVVVICEGRTSTTSSMREPYECGHYDGDHYVSQTCHRTAATVWVRDK